MDAVLGLSLTSCTIGWILLDGRSADANVLDHDVFDVSVNACNDGDISKHLAAVRGAQSIAATSGHKVTSIGVTWTEDADAKATLVLRALPELGVDRINAVRLPDAIRTWAHAVGPALDFEKCAICVVESAAVTALSFGYDSVRTFTNHMRESTDGIGRWLSSIFDTNGLEPDTLFLIGTRGDLELISETLENSLSIPVEATADTQLALAYGTALTLPAGAAPAIENSADKRRPISRWRSSRQSIGVAAKEDALDAWTEAIKKPARTVQADPGAQPVSAEISVAKVSAQAETATADTAEATHQSVAIAGTAGNGPAANQPDGEAASAPPRPAWMRAPAVDSFAVKSQAADEEQPHRPARMHKDSAADSVDEPDKTAAVTSAKPLAAEGEPKAEVITLSPHDRPAEGHRETRRTWYGPHARAATVVVVGLIGVFALAPVLITGQKDSTPTTERRASESATTSVSVQVVPSTPVPAAVHQVAVEPAPAPVPPPDARPPELTPTEAVAPVVEQETPSRTPVTASRTPITGEPLAVQQTPVAARPAPVAQPPAPAAPAPAAPVPPAPAAPAPAGEVPHLPGQPVPPPPQDPVMAVLGPLFSALP